MKIPDTYYEALREKLKDAKITLTEDFEMVSRPRPSAAGLVGHGRTNFQEKYFFFKKNNSFPKICNLVYNMVNFFMLQCNRNIVLLVRNVVNCILEIYLFKISRNPLDTRSSHFGCLYSLFLTGPSFICFLLAL